MRTSCWAIVSVLAALATSDATAAEVIKVPPYDQFIVVPLRVHILASKELDLANCTITDVEAARAAAGINAIWNKAGIYFGMESIVHEPAAQVARFKAVVALNQGKLPDVDVYAYLLPRSSRVFDGLHVYDFHELPLNGAYINAADAVILVESPQLKQVDGGSDNLISRVAARGLGQALSLPGRQDEVGLLSSGTNGVGLSEAEVGRARQVARTIPGRMVNREPAKAAGDATKRGDVATARRTWTWLSEVPGAGAAEAKKRLAHLPTAPKP